jgi:hypothetical protein
METWWDIVKEGAPQSGMASEYRRLALSQVNPPNIKRDSRDEGLNDDSVCVGTRK